MPIVTISRADLPRHVAMQIHQAMSAMPDKPVELSLNPQELGRVRLSVSTSEAGVTLHVIAERPETIEMMRRHADSLMRDLADLGFARVDLAFGQGQGADSGSGTGGEGRGNAGQPGASDQLAEPAEIETSRPISLTGEGGLDIRI